MTSIAQIFSLEVYSKSHGFERQHFGLVTLESKTPLTGSSSSGSFIARYTRQTEKRIVDQICVRDCENLKPGQGPR